MDTLSNNKVPPLASRHERPPETVLGDFIYNTTVGIRGPFETLPSILFRLFENPAVEEGSVKFW